MNKFTFLEENQITGTNQLEYFKKCGIISKATDYSILLGCETNENLEGIWWTKTFNSYAFHTTVSNDKNNYPLKTAMALARNIGARPVLIREKETENIKEIKYGEYPQSLASKEESEQLEKLYQLNILIKTGKEYTIDKNKNKLLKKIEEEKITEYEYNNKKYIRILGNLEWKNRTLSNGEKVKDEKPYWIKIEPIIWIIEKNIMFSKNILFSGIPFNTEQQSDTSFEAAEIKKYLDLYFEKEITPSKILKNKNIQNKYLEELIKSKIELLEIKKDIERLNELTIKRNKKLKELSEIENEINEINEKVKNKINTLKFNK